MGWFVAGVAALVVWAVFGVGGWCFGGGGWSEFPVASSGFLVEGLVVVVELVVAVAADICHVVCVGFAFGGRVVGGVVVGVAGAPVGAAEHAAFVAYCEGESLAEGCVAGVAAEPQRFSFVVEECADEVAVLEVGGEDGVGDWSDADLFGGE